MIGGIDITPDKWYHKLWFYPLIIALCIGWTIYGFIECAVIWLKRKKNKSTDWKRFVAGVNWKSWCIGLQIHDFRDNNGYVITEINLLPLTFLLRFGDGTKLLKCTRCKKVLDRVNVDEDCAAKCLDCYYGL